MACRPTVITWGDPAITWIATHIRTPWLDPIMHFFTQLGEMGAILFILSLGYWFWDKRALRFIGYGLFTAILVNVFIKGIIMECRPPSEFWLEYNHDLNKSYSFPSGHSQAAILMFAGLAYYSRFKWLSPILFIIGILVGLSRPYLGVHYPHDVLAAWLIGLSILGLCITFDKKQWQPLRNKPLALQALVLLMIFGACLLVLNDPTNLTLKVTSAFFGFWLGCQWDDRYLQFKTNYDYKLILSQMFIGLTGVFLLWKGVNTVRTILDLSEPINSIILSLQYTSITLWVTYIAPVIFTKIDRKILLTKAAHSS